MNNFSQRYRTHLIKSFPHVIIFNGFNELNGLKMSDKTINKIIGIGLSKTGTASLAYALRYLGFSCVHYPTSRDVIKNERAVVDGIVAIDFPYYDYYYPGSKFIYTVRNNYQDWIDSCRIHFEMKLPPEVLKSSGQNLHKLFLENMFPVWGTDRFSEEIWKKSYENHKNIVTEYFKDRPEDLLIIDICAGEGWEKLCRFLDKPIPYNEPFPKTNITYNPFKKV